MLMSTSSRCAAFLSPLVPFGSGLHAISITHVSHGQKASALEALVALVFITKLPPFFF